MASSFLLSAILLLLFQLPLSTSITEAETLLTFKSSISNNTALSSWDIKNPPCKGNSANWVGVLCIQDSVWGLQLENMGFTGTLNVSSLTNLPNLRTISFMNNRFDGPIPEIKKIPALKSVFLSRNRLSGEIPADSFTGMVWLKKLYLSQNQFTGAIPASLVSLPKLMEARLDGNHFEGLIPVFKTQNLVTFNVSDNALLGPIPSGLNKMPITMFQGNKGLCGQPLGPCNSPTALLPSPNDSSIVNGVRNTSKHTARSILIILILCVVALVAILAVMFALRRRSSRPNSVESPQSNLEKKTGIKEDQSSHGGSSHHSSAGRKGEVPKLSFVRDDREKFELPDLLKASAEILGSGCFGASYKAAPTTGSAMVVKRFKKMNNVGREEFHEHMRRIGRLNHPNLLPLVAYYYRKEEKLLVTDFVHNGSLAVHLHGHQSLGQPSLDWPTRLKIVKGVTAGLAYLYKELPSLIAPHGHLKSSNVLLNESYEPLLSDYGLIPVINQESAQELMVAYKSPEYFQNGRVTKKTDVWGLGILILEILTGKFPANFLKEGQGDEEDLAMLVSSIVKEGRVEEVFDKEMEMEKNSIGEMVRLLKIGLSCCENLENRLELKEAVEKIEELKEKDDHDDDHSSIISDGEKKSSRGLSDDSTMS
ncbi:hypothetical protein SLEP1_g30583 [Rubroshorea leprosula]|uniref:non-specific serine/threonine protein kinase n=1 Tax=Rubroshorea leprosula TaxID=152421 RepID=A0AAV5KA30_9ROSI|nr:hypothetical protein SLEP1_g30583 [Rubroshorea leprosula]